MYLSTLKPYCWLRIVYVSISLSFLNYIMYILNLKLGLTKKVKITEQLKWLTVIKEVKEIEVFVNKQKIRRLYKFIIDELQESWQTYQILLRTC